MSERKRVFLLVLIMAAATLTVAGTTILTLYRAAFQEQRSRLVETAQSQARLIEAVTRFDTIYSRDYPGGAEEATLAQITDAHEHYGEFGETGEFTLAKREGDDIVFLLRHRHFDLDRPKPVAYDSDLAEPMRLALSGVSGTVVGPDYRGELVLAAHEPVAELGQGIVAKIDLSEIRAPFVRAGTVAAIFALLVVTAGTGLFFRVSNPLIRRIEEHSQRLEEIVEALRESEARYMAMFENMSNGVAVYKAVNDGEDFMFLNFNKAAEKIENISRKDVIGKSVLDVFPGIKDFGLFDVFQRVWSTGKPEHHPVAMYKDKRISGWRENFVYKLPSGEIAAVYSDETGRKQAEETAKRAYSELNQIFQTAGGGMRVVDRDFNVLRINENFATLSGTPEAQAIGKKCYDGFPGPACHTTQCPLSRIMGGEEGVEYEAEKERSDGTMIPCIITATPFRGSDGELVGIVEDFKDITERKEAEEALQKAHDKLEKRVEERTAELVTANEQLKREMEERRRAEEEARLMQYCIEHASDAVFWVDNNACFVYANEAASRQMGYSRDELLSMKVHDVDPLYQKDNWPDFWDQFKDKGYLLIESINRSKDGREFPVEIAVNYLEYEGREIMHAYVRDITERKQAEEQIRDLSRELIKMQESEQQRLSRDLHDHLAQDLSALKIGLDTLFDNQPRVPSEVGQRVSELSGRLQEAVSVVRGLAHNLRPPSLDQLGLVQTILEHCEEFSDRNEVKVDFFTAGMDDLKLDFDTEINLYRIFQEALNNIQRHACASHVTVRLVASFPNFILRIKDNGKGFDVQKRKLEAVNERRMGLRSMEERVAILDGKMKIESHPMRGTEIVAEFPHKEKKDGQ